MLATKIITAMICAALIYLVIFFWRNALVMDDSHPANRQIQQENTQRETAVLQELPENANLSDKQASYMKKGWYIHVNLDEHTMYVYKDGWLIKTYPVSGGSAGTPSPLGTWKIISKETWGEGFGGAWLGFNVPWGDYGIHGTLDPWFIGRSNSSKGCIRMLNIDARELFGLVPYGTVVSIVHENKAFRMLKSGDIGSDVKEVQDMLKKLGYYQGYPDGIFGQYLENGIRKFQEDNNLWVSGTVYKKAYHLIRQKFEELDVSLQ